MQPISNFLPDAKCHRKKIINSTIKMHVSTRIELFAQVWCQRCETLQRSDYEIKKLQK